MPVVLNPNRQKNADRYCPLQVLTAEVLAASGNMRCSEPLVLSTVKEAGFMIRTEAISSNALKIIVPVKLKVADFRQIAPQVDSIICQYGKIRLLIDASQFSGWENIAAFENHAAFVKHHQDKVERIAVIVGHEWQHWLIGTVRIFVHPEVKAYDKGQEREALQWIAAESLPDGR